MCYRQHMRLHIEIDDSTVRRLDKIAGKRGRSTYIRRAIQHALDQTERWDLIESAVGSISDSGHEWDADPAEWVHRSRRSDRRRIG